MARLLGPDAGTRLALRVISGQPTMGMPGKLVKVYSDEACTTLADIAEYVPETPQTPGPAVAGSELRITRESLVPVFWFPDGVTTLWARSREGVVLRLAADIESRLAAEHDDFLPNENPELVNTTLLVRKADDSAGLRVRTTGSAVDLEKSATDIIVSTWSGALPGVGSQATLQRWRGDGTTFVGVTAFGSSAYANEMTVDVPNGFANFGGKNGLGTIRFCGFKATPGAPAGSPWAAGDLILDSAGAWHLCTVSGTPGTWT